MTVFQRIGRFFRAEKRATYSHIGPAKNWEAWQSLLLSLGGKAKVPVTERTVMGIPGYFRAVNIACEQFGSLQRGIYTAQENNIVTAETHPLYKLIRFRPSPLYNAMDFFETLARQLFVRGNAYIRMYWDNRGALSELRIINNKIEKIEEKDGRLFYKFAGDAQRYDSEEILHVKAYSLDGIIGLSPLLLLVEALGKSLAEISFGASFYGNGAHPSGALETDARLDKEQREALMQTFNEKYGGPENVGRVVLLTNGLKFKPISMDMDKAQYAQVRALSLQDIANITGVPLDLLNAADKSSTYASAEQRNLQFVQYTLRTICKKFEEEFNTKAFSSREMGKTFLRFNLDALLRGDTKARSEYYTAAISHRWMSPNEVRALENMNPYEGGDTYENPNTSTSNNQMNNDEPEAGNRETDSDNPAEGGGR